MSNLHPGGYRGPTYYSGYVDRRVFGFENILRACTQALKARDYTELGRSSIAKGNRHIRNIRSGQCAPHEHKREIARRSRQREGVR